MVTKFLSASTDYFETDINRQLESAAADEVSSGELAANYAILANTLLEWSSAPDKLQFEEDFVPPTRMAIKSALRFLNSMKDVDNYPSPNRMSPDGNGGVSFEWDNRNGFTTYKAHGDGAIEVLIFENGSLSCREILEQAPPSR